MYSLEGRSAEHDCSSNLNFLAGQCLSETVCHIALRYDLLEFKLLVTDILLELKDASVDVLCALTEVLFIGGSENTCSVVFKETTPTNFHAQHFLNKSTINNKKSCASKNSWLRMEARMTRELLLNELQYLISRYQAQ